jgi:hypothetical protein
VSYAGFATNLATNLEKPAYYPHTMPDHGAQIVDEGKWQQRNELKIENPQVQRARKREKAHPMPQVVYDRRHVDLFNEALNNPDHRLRTAAEQAMQGFTVAAEKAKIATLSQASREYHIPLKNLSEWVRKGLLPYTREKNAIILRRESLDKVAPVYHKATEQGKLAAPILRKMHDEIFPASTKTT